MPVPSSTAAIISLAFTTFAVAALLEEDSLHTRATGIQWGSCDDTIKAVMTAGNYSGTIGCANLTVPLDYINKSLDATIPLNLFYVPAPSGKSKGTIQFNFGGPGLPGRTQLASQIALWQSLTGYVWDLLAFDPRGTGNTLPYSCYSNETERSSAYSYEFNVNASDTAPGETWVRAGNTAGACALNYKYGPYVGTAATARDHMSVVDALGQDGLLHYYGGSYGTALGATLAAMFPDSIGHMVVDGVIDATDYYHDPAEAEYISLADETFACFFQGCVASPENCAIASVGKSARQLESEFYDWLYKLKYLPLGDGSSFQVRYSELKSSLRDALYSPAGWPRTSLVLKALYEGNVTQATALLQAGGSIAAGLSIAPEANLGIRAADRTQRVHNLEEYQPYLDKILESSKIIGDISTHAQMAVSQWKSSAVEVYNGDFRVKTKTGVLIASNTFDPLAPLAAGKRLSGLLEGSSLLINNGCGHTVLSQASICTIKHIRAYFVSDVLPTTNTVCEPDIPLFSTNITLADVLAKVEAEPQ